jgi:hypothetical protein
VKVRNIDVARVQALRRQFARIRPGTAIANLVAASVRQRECRLAVAGAGEFGRQVGKALRDEMHDLALALDAATYRDHAR